MVEVEKPIAPAKPDDALEEMRRESEAILAASHKLVKELEELLESGRQLRAAQAALLEQRRKNKAGE